MSPDVIRIAVPSHFSMNALIYTQATNQRDERFIEAPRDEMLHFAFGILERCFRASMEKP